MSTQEVECRAVFACRWVTLFLAHISIADSLTLQPVAVCGQADIRHTSFRNAWTSYTLSQPRHASSFLQLSDTLFIFSSSVRIHTESRIPLPFTSITMPRELPPELWQDIIRNLRIPEPEAGTFDRTGKNIRQHDLTAFMRVSIVHTGIILTCVRGDLSLSAQGGARSAGAAGIEQHRS